MTRAFIKDKLLLLLTAIGIAAVMLLISPLITEYMDIIFIFFVIAMFYADRLEIRRLKAEIKQLKKRLAIVQEK